MKRPAWRYGALLLGMAMSGIATSAPVIYTDEAAFRAAAGSTTTYGFETHGVTEGTDLASPVPAASLDSAFQLSHTGLNLVEIVEGAGSPNAVEGTHFLFTHSSAIAPNYSLTFSDFGGTNRTITAFGLTVIDFASNLGGNAISTILYSAGASSGTLLTVIGGQPDYTQNFVGLIVDPAEAFTSITLTLNDVGSGFQSFDEVIYTATARLPEPGTSALFAIALLGLAVTRRR